MNQIVIVDDEPIILEGVSEAVKQMALPVEIAGSFTSSVEALSFLKDQQVEVVLTDINMPQYTGLDLIKRVNQLNPATEIVVLTGFGTLAYATEAMRHGVKFFLEKPVDTLKLEEAIRASLAYAEEAKKGRRYQEKSELEHLIMDQRYSSEFIQAPFSLVMYDATLFSSVDEVLSQELEKNFTDIVSGSAKGAVYYAIFGGAGVATVCADLLERRKLPQGVLFVKEVVTPGELYRDFIYGQSMFSNGFYYDRMTCFSEAAAEAEKELDYPNIVETFKQEVVQLLDENRFTELDTITDEFFRRAKRGLFPVNFLRFQLQIFSETLLKQRALKKSEMDIEISLRILNATSNKELHYLFKSIINRIKTERQLDDSGDIVANLNLIIENEFQNEALSLRWIAKNRLFLHPEYLGKVYLKATDKKFNQALLEKRIQVGKELILQNKKVYEVAEAVGFHDNPEYFTKKFKELVGKSPKAYQMSHI